MGVKLGSFRLKEERRLRIFEIRLLRKIFWPKRDEVTEEWRRLRNEELHDLYSSRNIIRMIKSRTMKWAGHKAHMGEKRRAYTDLVRKPEGKRPLRNFDVDVRIILKLIKEYGVFFFTCLADKWSPDAPLPLRHSPSLGRFNLLKTKRNLLYITNKFIPRSKHFLTPL